MNAASLRVVARLDALATIRHFVEARGTELGADPEAIADLVQAADEAATNVAVHGYGLRGGPLAVRVTREGDRLVVVLTDEAPPFDPTTRPAPDLSLGLAERPIGGLGVYMIRRLTDEFVHRRTRRGGNELRLARRAFAATGPAGKDTS